MKVVDANVLLHAVNTDARHHEASRVWLDNALSGNDTVGLSWIALLAFLRLSTLDGLFPRSLSVDVALRVLDSWTTAPGGVVVHPVPRTASTWDACSLPWVPEGTSSTTRISRRLPSSSAPASSRTTGTSRSFPTCAAANRTS